MWTLVIFYRIGASVEADAARDVLVIESRLDLRTAICSEGFLRPLR
jgi:hypothetical protein